MKKLLTFFVMFIAIGTFNAFSQATDIFFSEYIEGSSNNKALEIFNGTGADVDLANYVIRINSNGGTWTSLFNFPVGTILAKDDVYVIAHSAANASILAVTDSVVTDPYATGSSYVAVFNGDDVRGLFKVSGNDTLLIDIIGKYDQIDPGSGWSVAGIANGTQDHTIVRKATVVAGNTDWVVAAGTNADDSEWIVNAKDDFSNLGSHVFEGGAPSTETDILTFSLTEQSADATINSTDHTISIEVVAGTTVTALVPTITVSEGATINPESGVAQDFTSPVVYTVTAEDGTTTQMWTVTVTVAVLPSSEAEILTFSFVEEVSEAVINSEAATITSLVKWNADLEKLEPTITVSIGAQVTATVLPVDFTNPVVYRVTAQNLTTTKDWTVTVTKDVEPNHAAEITAFELSELSAAAVINSEAATIVGVLVAGTNVTALTPTLTLSEGATYTPSGVQDFTNPVVYTVTAQDGETTKDWTVTLTTLEIETVTIHDIQFTEDASGDSPLINQVVKTKGVVTALEAKAFYLQDGAGAWNGVYVYQNAAPTVVIGDSVLVEGKISEYNKLTEIASPVITVLNSGNTVASSTTLSVADFKQEMYEGVLVTISNVTCISEVANKNWKVKAVESTDTVIVRNGIFDYTPVLNQIFASITGFGGQYKNDYQLFPRSAEDIIITSISDEQLAMVNIYPNPVETELKLDNLNEVSSIMISNILGQTLKTIPVKSSVLNIDLSGLNNGIYVITLKSFDGTTRSERFIKK